MVSWGLATPQSAGQASRLETPPRLMLAVLGPKTTGQAGGLETQAELRAMLESGGRFSSAASGTLSVGS
jgi:hypothetical protein